MRFRLEGRSVISIPEGSNVNPGGQFSLAFWEIAIKSTVIRQASYLSYGKLATQSERKCARHSTNDEYIALGPQYAHRAACAPNTSCARPTLLFSLAGCSMNRKPDFNPS